MASRLSLQSELKSIIGVRSDGKENVCFQPPESLKLVYPCICYIQSPGDQKYADNRLYSYMKKYEITVIYKDPDSDLPLNILKHFDLIRMDRTFISDNLYHTVFTLYY